MKKEETKELNKIDKGLRMARKRISYLLEQTDSNESKEEKENEE